MTRRPETERSDTRAATSRPRRRLMNDCPMTSPPCQDGRRRGGHVTRSAASRAPEEWPMSRTRRGGRSRRRATLRRTKGDVAGVGCRSASVADVGADAAASRSRAVAVAAAANSEDVCGARSRVDVLRPAPRPTRRRRLDVAATYDHPGRRRLPLRQPQPGRQSTHGRQITGMRQAPTD